MAEQNYSNHTRWYPLFHFVVNPLLLLALAWNSVMLYQQPSWDRLMMMVFIITVAMLGVASRLQSLKVQDRVIRLEEKIRHRDVLSPELAARAAALTPSQLTALRFASDDELAELIEQALTGRFVKTKDIKLAIKRWRADHLRA